MVGATMSVPPAAFCNRCAAPHLSSNREVATGNDAISCVDFSEVVAAATSQAGKMRWTTASLAGTSRRVSEHGVLGAKVTPMSTEDVCLKGGKCDCLKGHPGGSVGRGGSAAAVVDRLL